MTLSELLRKYSVEEAIPPEPAKAEQAASTPPRKKRPPVTIAPKKAPVEAEKKARDMVDPTVPANKEAWDDDGI